MLMFCTLVLVPVRARALGPLQGALAQINEARVNHGCGFLKEANDSLVRSARRHSRLMASYGRIFHSVLRIGRWALVGEVVGVGSTVHGIVRAMFNSPEHRRILLDCRYDVMAVGLFFDNDLVWMTGRLYA